MYIQRFGKYGELVVKKLFLAPYLIDLTHEVLQMVIPLRPFFRDSFFLYIIISVYFFLTLFHVHCWSFFNKIILICKKGEKKNFLFCCELPLMCCSLRVCLVERILGVTEEGRGSEVFISSIEKKIGRKDRGMGRYFHPVPHILTHPKWGDIGEENKV